MNLVVNHCSSNSQKLKSASLKKIKWFFWKSFVSNLVQSYTKWYSRFTLWYQLCFKDISGKKSFGKIDNAMVLKLNIKRGSQYGSPNSFWIYLIQESYLALCDSCLKKKERPIVNREKWILPFYIFFSWFPKVLEKLGTDDNNVIKHFFILCIVNHETKLRWVFSFSGSYQSFYDQGLENFFRSPWLAIRENFLDP